MLASEPIPRVRMRDIVKRYGATPALDGVDFDAYPGEVHALCGENGAGKSTLMKILAGVVAPDQGEIEIAGQALRFHSPHDAQAAGVRMIHQELGLVPGLSAAANIFLGSEPRTRLGLCDDRAMIATARPLLDRLGASIDPRTPVGRLPIGDQQLVEIARALAREAGVLIMDEPTSALAVHEADRLFRIIAGLRSSGAAILYVSHKMNEIFRLADRVTVLRDGRLVRSSPAAGTSPEQVVRDMVGRPIARSDRARPTGPPAAPVLEVRNLSWQPSRGRGRGTGLRAISLHLHSGEVVGLAGLLGAGRTELLEVLFGARGGLRDGTVHLQGRPCRFRHTSQAVAAGLALVPEDRKHRGLFDRLDVAANITVAHLGALARLGLRNRVAERLAVAQAITRHQIRTSGPATPVSRLSGGNQQKCILARWLVSPPRVLLLDEPTRGIDVAAKAQIHAMVRQLARREGLAVLLASSELPELLEVCDRILVLCEGRLTGEFNAATATEAQIMEAATRFRGPSPTQGPAASP